MDGIIGTVVGLIVGAIISHFQTNYGKIQISFLNPTYYFEKVELNKDDRVVYEKTVENRNAHMFYFDSVIELYNSANSRKILRNIKLCIETNKGNKYYDIYTDNGTPFKSLNIDAKSIVTHDIVTKIERSARVEKLFEDKILSVYLVYNDEKNKKNKMKIESIY